VVVVFSNKNEAECGRFSQVPHPFPPPERGKKKMTVTEGLEKGTKRITNSYFTVGGSVALHSVNPWRRREKMKKKKNYKGEDSEHIAIKEWVLPTCETWARSKKKGSYRGVFRWG